MNNILYRKQEKQQDTITQYHLEQQHLYRKEERKH